MLYNIEKKVNVILYKIKKYGIWYIINSIDKQYLFIFIKKIFYSISIFKMKRKKQIKVAFINVSATSWCAHELFQYFYKDSRFLPYLIVIPLYNGTDITIKKMYQSSMDYFIDEGYPVTGTIKGSIYENKDWVECGKPDIVFYLNPHSGGFPTEWRPQNLPLSKILIAYIPYGFMISDVPEMHYNQLLHKLCWKIFAESEKAKEMAQKYSDIGDSNIVASGYPKMDVYYSDNLINKSYIWKTSQNIKNVKKIIYSPHHSVPIPGDESGNPVAFSTFDKNYKFILKMAQKYESTTSWIFKPHPLLEKGALAAGVFKNDAEWSDYVNEWNNLPNGKAVLDGTYDDIFKTCDAIINDSVSFLAEILYVHKSMLFLKSDSNTFNEFGKELIQVHFSCYGDDYDKIEDYLINIINNNEDKTKLMKEKFFDEFLNYKKNNGCLASEYIYQYICNAVTK
jgi:Putative glycosyl/glycerophosphate transferases involved in teichoic acid biosynthesis TagF/TagB/EpsJ/RodC